jgi:hypothetical protein
MKSSVVTLWLKGRLEIYKNFMIYKYLQERVNDVLAHVGAIQGRTPSTLAQLRMLIIFEAMLGHDSSPIFGTSWNILCYPHE